MPWKTMVEVGFLVIFRSVVLSSISRFRDGCLRPREIRDKIRDSLF